MAYGHMTARAAARRAGLAAGTVLAAASLLAATAPADGATVVDGATAGQGVPVVTGVSPRVGLATGGTAVTVTGSGFAAGDTVTFGSFGNPDGTGVTVSPDGTRLTALTPPALAGPVRVVVTGPDGSSVASPASTFSYLLPPALAHYRPGWIVKGDALSGFAALNPALVGEFFDNRDTFVVVNDYGSACPVTDPIVPPPGDVPQPCTDNPIPGHLTEAVPTAAFASYAKMRAVLDAGALPPGIKAVLYDPEDWPFTPVDEQLNLAAYAQDVASLAHAHGLTFIDTPAQDLVNTLGRNPGETVPQAVLRYQIPAIAARYADVVDLQVQGYEPNYVSYLANLTAYADQARAANPRIRLLAGLATNPGGQVVTPEQITQAAVDAQPLVSGYWLNDAFQSVDCPACNGPYPSRATGFLAELAHPFTAP
jgi:hypothetical protein